MSPRGPAVCQGTFCSLVLPRKEMGTPGVSRPAPSEFLPFRLGRPGSWATTRSSTNWPAGEWGSSTARQVHLGRTVALKLVRDPSLATHAEILRFRKEAEAVAELDHPNIVPIYEVGQTEDQPYFSMKLIEGGSLTLQVVRLREDPRAAAALMAKVARAVHYAHQHAILHRDLKPSNILIGDNDEPYVTDFGLAKRLDAGRGTAQTVTGAVMGTPAYMPPEQAGGGTKWLTTAADVYSLGATLYEVLTGQPPFAGDSVHEILRRVVDEEPARPTSLNPRLDRDLATICLKCLEKAPSRRYGTAGDLADDLALLAGRPADHGAAGPSLGAWLEVDKAPARLGGGLRCTLPVPAGPDHRRHLDLPRPSAPWTSPTATATLPR